MDIATKKLFMNWAPRSEDDRQELPCFLEEDTPIAGVAQKAPRSRIDEECGNCGRKGHTEDVCRQKLRCDYCKRPGHLIDECRQKRYNGYATPIKLRLQAVHG